MPGTVNVHPRIAFPDYLDGRQLARNLPADHGPNIGPENDGLGASAMHNEGVNKRMRDSMSRRHFI